MSEVSEYNVDDEMEKALGSIIDNYKNMVDVYMRITAKITGRNGNYLGCEVVFSPRDKHLHHVTVNTRYGTIKVRSLSGDRLVKTIDEDMCEYFDAFATEHG